MNQFEHSNIKDNFELLDPIIKNSLEYYDSYQDKINNIINNTEYIELINNNNITDTIIFYDSHKKNIFESKYEILSIFVPETKMWKWSWSLPTADKKHTFITRKILDYAFNLNPEKDYLLKSTLINSKIKILNQLQLDIHIALSASLSKKPFIFKFYLAPLKFIYNDNDIELDSSLYPYKKIMDHKDKDKLISVYFFILDF